MILPDANVLIYAVNRSSDQHAAALKTDRSDPGAERMTWYACRGMNIASPKIDELAQRLAPPDR